MSIKKVHEKVTSRKIIDRMMEHTGLRQQDIATQIFKISDKNLSNKIKRNTVDMFEIFSWASNENVDLTWLITGEKSKSKVDENWGVETQVNTHLLSDCIEAVDSALQKTNKQWPLQKKARFIALQYEYYMDSKKNVNREEIVRRLKLVA